MSGLPLDSLPGPDNVTRYTLANGITLLVRENHDARSVVITGKVQSGSVFDPPAKEGLASFVASALLRGTERRDFSTIHELLEVNAASLVFSGGTRALGFSGKSLGEDLPLLLDLLADALRRPAFPGGQVERLRGEIITGLKIREQSTRYVASRAFRQLAYPPEHPYHRDGDGELHTIQAVTQDDLVEFHRHYIGPRSMTVVIVGAVQTAEVVRLVEDQLGDWDNPAQPELPPFPELSAMDAPRIQAVTMPDKSQADLVLGIPGPSRLAGDWYAANLGNSILGVFGMYGRLGREVREKRGMAYYSFSRLDGGLGPGAWRVVAGVNPANVQRTVEVILGEIERLINEPVTEDELADNKANFTGSMPLQLETNEGVAGALLNIERYQLGLDYLRRYPAIIEAVTADDILAAARHYWNPAGYALGIAGPEWDATAAQEKARTRSM